MILILLQGGDCEQKKMRPGITLVVQPGMKPPICELCGHDFRHQWDGSEAGGGLVQFSDYRPPSGDRVGHPAGLGFFCSTHLTQARSLHHLSMTDAMKRMKEPG